MPVNSLISMMIFTIVRVNAFSPCFRVIFMLPALPISYDPHNDKNGRNRIIPGLIFFSFICFFPFYGCAPADKTAASSSARARTKPEGLLLIVRELDLGTLPAGGSMEAVLSLKNPSSDKSYAPDSIKISQPGFSVEPATFSIAPEATQPLTFKISPDATRTAGAMECNVSAQSQTGELLFRTTLRIVVK